MIRRVSLLALAALCGCRSEPPPPETTPSAPAHVDPAQAAPATAAAPHRFEARLMGTPFSIVIPADVAPAIAAEGARAAFAEVARVEAAMSEWRPDSEVSRINDAAGRAVPVSDETRRVLGQALELARHSGGAFDPSWAALRGLWRFDADRPRLPARSALTAALARVDHRRVHIEGETVRLGAAGMALGLGGIAKGHGIDRAAAVLRARGIEAFIVDGGGDLYVSGRKPGGASWTVGVRHPRRDGVLIAELPARDAAVVSSGDYERFFELGGRRYHHIIDLRTGQPATASVAVTVRAPEATLADALATALFVLGPEAGLALAARYPGVDAAIMSPDGRIATTPGFEALFDARWRGADRP